MKKNLLAMNLQFFAEEGADVNEAEVVDQPEGEAEAEAPETEGVKEEPAEPQFQSDKANAAFASMRREVEQARKAMADLDAMYAKQFGSYTNPETGEPIRNARDYVEAMEAQKRVQAREQLRQNNIDPSLIDNAVANSPIVRQAEAAIAELNNYRTMQSVEKDINEVLKLDPSLNKDTLVQDPKVQESIQYINAHPGISFVDAYKIVNFDRLASSQTAAAKQAVVNQVKGQAHLANGNALTTTDSEDDIPASMLENYKELFPDKSMKELKALYNRTMKSRR